MADEVKLVHIADFRAALEHYKVSAAAQKVLDEAKLVVLSGLAGGGRNTVINNLVQKHDYFFLVSDTTRPPKIRDGAMEQNGVHYYFRSEEDMLQDIRDGAFIEAEIIHNQQVSGTSIRELARANATGRTAIHDFEYGGAHNVAMADPKAIIIGLLPPDYDEWIRRFRGREELHNAEFINRLHTAEKVLIKMLSEPYFRLVLNDRIEQCVADILAIVDNKIDPQKQVDAKQVAEELLDKVRQTLASE